MMNTKQQGFTLIELMIALTIGLIIALGVTQIYANTRQTNRVQGMQSMLSDDGRFALAMLRRTISQAGFRPDPFATFNGTNALARITATSATNATVTFTADGANTMACDGSSGTASGTAVSEVISFASSKLTCTSTVGATVTAVDWIEAANGGDGSEVVDFQLSYGVDTSASVGLAAEYLCGVGRDCVADSFVAALPGGVTADQIVAVKVCLILRSQKKDSGIIKAANFTNCAGSAITSTQNDGQLYRVFRSTILIKNLLTNS